MKVRRVVRNGSGTDSETHPVVSSVDTPAFSFLTTAYLSEGTLGRTIESILAQTRSDWELVVVDNGRRDEIVDIVRPYLDDSRIRLVRQENRGPHGGVMAASEVATGRYFAVVNSDDAVAPEFCARIGAILDAQPEVAAVTCDADRFSDPGEVVLPVSYLDNAGQRGTPDPAVPLRVPEVIDGPCPYYSGAVRREVWTALGGWNLELPVAFDLDLWLRILLAGHDVRTVPERLGRFAVSDDSSSNPADSARIEEFEMHRDAVLAAAAEADGSAEAHAALRAVRSRNGAVQSLRRSRLALLAGDVRGARRHARAAFRARRSLRGAAVVAAVHLAPGLTVRAHPQYRAAAAVPVSVESTVGI
jgi:GT2 family glycosyltransferase